MVRCAEYVLWEQSSLSDSLEDNQSGILIGCVLTGLLLDSAYLHSSPVRNTTSTSLHPAKLRAPPAHCLQHATPHHHLQQHCRQSWENTQPTNTNTTATRQSSWRGPWELHSCCNPANHGVSQHSTTPLLLLHINGASLHTNC